MKNQNENFVFKKKFGQNFLSDKNLLASLVKLTPLSKTDSVLEIGLGKGGLTQILSNSAKKVVGYEIDVDLSTFLQEKFENTNVELVFKDALKENIKNIENNFGGEEFCLVANIPYYITTPLLFKFMEETNNCKFQALMIQKEVAERICAKPSTENYGSLSVISQFHNKCKILKVVPKRMFFPVPKVDSAFILLEKIKPFDFEYSNFVRASFNMRRKTLVNNITASFEIKREDVLACLEKINLEASVRAENLSPDQFYVLLQQIKTYFIK